jgi:hypothetical protein
VTTSLWLCAVDLTEMELPLLPFAAGATISAAPAPPSERASRVCVCVCG